MKLKEMIKGLNIISQELRKDMTVIDFYTMLRSYNISSNNIAVINDIKSFRNIAKHFKSAIKKERGDRIIQIDENHYIFIIDDIDRHLVYIDDISDLDNMKIVFGKYI